MIWLLLLKEAIIMKTRRFLKFTIVCILFSCLLVCLYPAMRAEGAQVDHSFLSPGVYEVSLTVVDQMGERGRTSVSIRVLPV